MKNLILTAFALFAFFYGHTQCKFVTLTEIKTVYKSQEKEDYLTDKDFVKDFDSISYYGFVRCQKIVAKSQETSITSYDESFTIFQDGTLFYSTYSNSQYLKLKKEILLKAKKTGKTENGYQYYFDGKLYYGFRIESHRSVNDKNLVYNEYKIMLTKTL